LILFHPTAAGSERAFSLLNNYVAESQSALSDETLLAQVATQCNDNQTRRADKARNKPVHPNDYRSIWTGIRDFLAKQQGYVTWSNRPPQPNNRNRPGPLAQMFASIGSQPHEAQVQAYQAQARGQP
jgi:hypothetical protein